MSDSRAQTGAPAATNEHPPGRNLLFAVGVATALGAGAAMLASYVTGWSEWSRNTATTLLASALAGAFVGAAIGAVVWLLRPRREVGGLQLLTSRGLIGAGTAVLTLALAGALWGLVEGTQPPFGSGKPGVESAVLRAFLLILWMGLPAGLLGFIIGGSVALLIRVKRSNS